MDEHLVYEVTKNQWWICPNGCKNHEAHLEEIGDRPACSKCGYWLVLVDPPRKAPEE